jgi:HK97 family phage major capsid protein
MRTKSGLAGSIAAAVVTDNGGNRSGDVDLIRRTLKFLVWAGAVARPDAANALRLLRGKGTTVATKPTKPTGTKGAPTVGTKAAKLVNGARVKDASERLSTKKYGVKNPRTGNPLAWCNKPCETASEKDHAIIGVWFKNTLRKQGVPVHLSEFEKSLLAETVQKGRWVGQHPDGRYFGGSDSSDFVPTTMVKALLDDTISGGIEITPYEFDSNVITFPLLSGELFPLVEVVPVTARRIKGGTIQNPTLVWGVASGVALQPYNTAQLVAPLDTVVWPVGGALEIGNEMIADSPVNLGATITTLYGERLKAELDKVIMAGNGYNQPLGVTNTSGLVNVTSDNASGGPPTVSDYEGLIFSVAKQYRDKDWNCAFAANDTTYRRARGIQVGPGDERRVLGMSHQEYKVLDYDFKIQNDTPNNKIVFGAWKRYRMYQRLGSEVVVTREGRQLSLANTTLVVIRSRFGGQPVDINSFALMANAQS